MNPPKNNKNTKPSAVTNDVAAAPSLKAAPLRRSSRNFKKVQASATNKFVKQESILCAMSQSSDGTTTTPSKPNPAPSKPNHDSNPSKQSRKFPSKRKRKNPPNKGGAYRMRNNSLSPRRSYVLPTSSSRSRVLPTTKNKSNTTSNKKGTDKYIQSVSKCISCLIL